MVQLSIPVQMSGADGPAELLSLHSEAEALLLTKITIPLGVGHI